MAHWQESRWWREERGAAHRLVVQVAQHLVERATMRHELDRRHLRLYAGAEYMGLAPSEYSRVLPYSDRVAWNVISSAIDTYLAKIIRSTPAPQFVTSGADWQTRRKTERLNKFGKGCLEQSGAYRLAATVERDAAIFGTGVLHVYALDKRIASERVFPWEILVDDTEAMAGDPRSLFRRKFVDRAVLAARYADDDEARQAIEHAKEPPRGALGRDSTADQVEVYEAWHLPSSRDSDDGRHVIALDGATLYDEPWTRQRFPFAVRRYVDPVAGWWGIGVAERLTGIQLEINKLLLRIQGAHHLLGRPVVILDETSGIPKSHITNEVAAVLVSRHPGTPIQVATPPTMPSDVYEHLMTLRAQAFEEVGVSQLDATARKPAGLDSGVALREYADIGSERFMLHGKRREEWHIDVVACALDEAREIDGFALDVPNRRHLERVRWADVSIEDSAYVLRVFPSSILPQQPAARLQKVQEMIAAGFVRRENAYDLLEFPDLDDARDQETAPINAVRDSIDKILDGEPAPSPEGFDALDQVVYLGTRTYLQERTAGAPEEVLEELRRYVTEAAAVQQLGAQPAAAPPGAGLGADAAAAEAVPQSVPVVPPGPPGMEVAA